MPRKKFSMKDAFSCGEVPIQAMVGPLGEACARAASGHAANRTAEKRDELAPSHLASGGTPHQCLKPSTLRRRDE
jgi:hypothetical protein